jgi:MOSC domain-containing protein YiiM
MRIVHIFVCPEHIYVGHHGKEPGAEPMREVAEVECVTGQGLRGDRYFGFKDDYKGQVTFFEDEAWEMLCEKFDERDKSVSVFRRNVIVRGVDLNQFIGKEFEVQGVRFLGIEESKPCYWMNTAFGPGAERALMGRGGLRAKILSNGVLRRDA